MDELSPGSAVVVGDEEAVVTGDEAVLVESNTSPAGGGMLWFSWVLFLFGVHPTFPSLYIRVINLTLDKVTDM